MQGMMWRFGEASNGLTCNYFQVVVTCCNSAKCIMISNEREREICIYIYAHGHGCSNQLHDWMIFGYVGHEFGQVSHLSNHLPRMLYRWCFLHNLYTAFNLFYLSWGSLYMRIIHIITYLYLSIYIYIHFYTYILIYIYTYNIYISYYIILRICGKYVFMLHYVTTYHACI
jgi:hypothetical protein